MKSLHRNPPELWGGVECTVNRVGDVYFDQMMRSGHAARLSDLDLFAGLGLRALRYPLLWERIAPHGPADADWRWADERLSRLRELGIRPIVGLVHHGSGPRGTSLLDPAFPERLAEFAQAVAARYPWVTHYTPINEPLTTARFSGLYGHWYPHGRDELTFVRALLTESRATIQAMQAIRSVTPQAQLVQTEDLAKTYSTPALAYQAAFENERRWLSLDLLCGRITRGHRMRRRLDCLGFSSAELDWFEDHACPPDVVGVNYYPTSERFLDERLDRYPPQSWGGNGRHAYADVEAVRVRQEGIAGLHALLQEMWERYERPIAVTEAHLGCTPDEQVRWLAEIWQEAQAARAAGIPLEAVTAWALLGSYDWDSLVTQDRGHYEPGVFDVSDGDPRPTPLAELVRALGAGHPHDHPALAHPGWWRRPERLLYPPVACPVPSRRSPSPAPRQLPPVSRRVRRQLDSVR